MPSWSPELLGSNEGVHGAYLRFIVLLLCFLSTPAVSVRSIWVVSATGFLSSADARAIAAETLTAASVDSRGHAELFSKTVSAAVDSLGHVEFLQEAAPHSPNDRSEGALGLEADFSNHSHAQARLPITRKEKRLAPALVELSSDSEELDSGDAASLAPWRNTSSQLELGVLGHVHAYARDTPAAVLAVVAIASFIVGGCVAGAIVVCFRTPTETSAIPTTASRSRVSWAECDTNDSNDNYNVLPSSLPARSAMARARGSSMFDDLERLISDSGTALGRATMSLQDYLRGDLSDEDEDEDEDAEQQLKESFDFETHDTQENRIHRWEWCDADQVEAFSVQTHPTTKPFEGYKRMDISATKKDVENLLLKTNVDFTEFNLERDSQSLLWKLLRSEAYFMARAASVRGMMVDDDLPNRKVLLMVETVRVRWTYAGHVLVQKCDASFLGAQAGIPGKEKRGSESPIATAKNFWEGILGLPVDIATFAEDGIQDEEILGYKGLRCVERAHIIEVKLSTLELDVMGKVGLPEHEDFCIESDEEEGRLVRQFQWKTREECEQEGIIASSFQPVAVIDVFSSQTLNSEASRVEQLRCFLADAGVDVESAVWQQTKGNATKLQALSREVRAGKCSLTNTSDGLHRCVNLVALRIWSPDRRLMLVEKGRKWPSGEEAWDAQLPGSKKDGNESLQDAALRLCQRQLAFIDDDISFTDDNSWEYASYTETSSRYPGLLTKYQKFFIDVVLEDDSKELLQRVGLADRIAERPETRAGRLSQLLNRDVQLEMSD